MLPNIRIKQFLLPTVILFIFFSPSICRCMIFSKVTIKTSSPPPECPQTIAIYNIELGHPSWAGYGYFLKEGFGRSGRDSECLKGSAFIRLFAGFATGQGIVKADFELFDRTGEKLLEFTVKSYDTGYLIGFLGNPSVDMDEVALKLGIKTIDIINDWLMGKDIAEEYRESSRQPIQNSP